MAEMTVAELREKLAETKTELEHAQKRLKRPSTISFAERRDLSNRAARAATESEEQHAILDGKEDGAEGVAELVKTAEEALGRAQEALRSVDAAQPAGMKRSTGSGDRRLPGQNRRGAPGPSQQRGPDRRGGD